MAKFFDNKVIDPDLRGYTDWLFKEGSTVNFKGRQIGWKILGLQERNEKRLSKDQLERKKLRKALDIEGSKFVDQIISKMPNTQLKDRLENLKTCET